MRRLFWCSTCLCFLLGAFLTIAGCGGSGGSSISSVPNQPAQTAPLLVSGGAQVVYVAQGSSNQNDTVLGFTPGINGSVSPSVIIRANRTVESLATDASGQLYVGGLLSPNICDIQVFPAGASSSTSPLRNILLPGGNYCPTPLAIAADSTGATYVGTDSNIIYVYAPAANGLAGPVRTIAGNATGLTASSGINQIAVDSAGVLYVALTNVSGNVATGSVAVFAAGSNGNIAPIRTITNTVPFTGIAIDSTGTVYTSLLSSTIRQIDVFAPAASGAANPQKTIIPGSSASYFYNLQVDSVGNIYIGTAASAASNFSITAVPPSSSGTVFPVLTTTSPSWTAGNRALIAVH